MLFMAWGALCVWRSIGAPFVSVLEREVIFWEECLQKLTQRLLYQ